MRVRLAAAPVHTRVLSGKGADARRDALRDEHVPAVHDRRPQPESGPDRVQRSRAGARQHKREPVEATPNARAVRRDAASRPSATAATVTITGNVYTSSDSSDASRRSRAAK